MMNDSHGYFPHTKSFQNAYLALPNNAGFLDLRKGINISPYPTVTYNYDHISNKLNAHTPDCVYSITPESISRGAHTNLDGTDLYFKTNEHGTHFTIHNAKGHVCHYYYQGTNINSFFSEYGQYGTKYAIMRVHILKNENISF